MDDLNPHVHYFVRKHCTDQWVLFPTVLTFYDLTFVISGSAVYHTKDRDFPLQAGQAVFLRPGELRSAETQGMECAAFSFVMDSHSPWPSGILRWNQDEQLLHWLRLYEQKWFSLEKNKAVACKGIFLLILARLQEISEAETENPHVREIRRYLEVHFLEKITVSEVARHVGLNVTYCGALFKKETGKTILQTVSLLRVTRAAELLRSGGISVTEAALSCGYSDIFYFSRVFKAVTGQSPEHFTEENRQASS